MNYGLRIKKKGFTLLYSVLISSILLSIGLAIFNLTIKELILSSLGRESQFAFYAADTGTECALYWDIGGSNNAFSTSSPATEINCNGEARSIDTTGSSGNIYKRSFQIDFGDDPYCAEVSVEKDTSSGAVKTTVESKGYNTCTASSRRVERAIRVKY